MFSSVFNSELYTCHLHVVDSDNLVQSKVEAMDSDHRGEEPKTAPRLITDDWLSQEIAEGFIRDMNDPFYNKGPQHRMDGLGEVIHLYKGSRVLVILNSKNQLFGKIDISEQYEMMTVNAMILYVLGDRRRCLDRSKKHIPSAFIVWYFLALYSRSLFGVFARVLITFPRYIIYKTLIRAGALFVELEENGIYSTISKLNRLSTHDEIIGIMTKDQENESMYGNFGALFHVNSLCARVEETERNMEILRSG